MTRIVIEPAPAEFGVNRDAYEALVEDLCEQGFTAELRAPKEQRFGLPQEFVNAALWLGEEVGRDTLAAIVAIFIDRMRASRRRRKKPPPRPPVAVFYGPHGERLQEIEIPERTEDD